MIPARNVNDIWKFAQDVQATLPKASTALLQDY